MYTAIYQHIIITGHKPAGRGLRGVQQSQAVHRGEAGQGRADPARPSPGGPRDEGITSSSVTRCFLLTFCRYGQKILFWW